VSDPATDVATPSTSLELTRRPWFPRPSFLGLCAAVASFGASITPSLLPRPWLFEGVIAGLGFAIGYGVGVAVSWLLRLVRVPEPSSTWKRRAWVALSVLGPLFTIYYLLLGVGWQNEVRTLVGESDEGLSTSLEVAVVAVPVAVLAILLGRVLRRFNGAIVRRLSAVIPRLVAGFVAVAAIGVLIYVVVTGVLFHGFVSVMNNLYAGANASTATGAAQPTSPQDSGSSASLVSWSSLGMEGRNFVSRGPTAAELTTFNGTPATTPVRVYVGLDSAPSAADRAALAVRELDRTGAFDRAVLVVAGTTGTGWIEPQTRNTIEYEWNGDTAIVGIQYSYLPSWISTLVDVDKAADAGRALYDAVYAKWSTLPVDHRPRLLAYGLSLGSYSIQQAFRDQAALTARTQGAVLVGSPNFSQPWGEIASDRAPTSPQWQPVYRDGLQIRFAGVPSDLDKPDGPWGPPRVAYVQHANDPVVWWSPQLLVEQPDWLAEPPGPGRTPTMRWYPVLTFLQVTVDQFVGVDVPDGQGHNYAGAMPGVFAAVAPPPDWTAADTARLAALIPTLDNY
jgi:uncharacterized membrane protein